MSAAGLKDFRSLTGASHEEMAKRMGIKLDDYLALEDGTRRFTRLHTLAFERLGLFIAADLKDPSLAPPPIRRAALRLAEVVLQQARPKTDEGR